MNKVKIWFYDLKTNQWFQSQANLLVTMWNSMHIVDGRNNYLYCFKCVGSRIFFKVHWMDVIPQKLQSLYKETINKKAVVAFIHKFEIENDLQHGLTRDLRDLVLQDFPPFLI